MKLLQEFKEFAVKGNVIDLATAVIVGGAFGKIVSSLVADIIMPLVGLISGGSSFSSWSVLLRAEKLDELGETLKPALELKAGLFIQNIIDFLIISASIFLMLKLILNLKNRLEKEKEEEKKEKAPTPAPELELLREIRDLLKTKN